MILKGLSVTKKQKKEKLFLFQVSFDNIFYIMVVF